jgi:hypothetical protein
MKVSTSLAVTMSKILMRTLVESSDQVKAIGLSADMYHKKLDKVLAPLQDLIDKLPPTLSGSL